MLKDQRKRTVEYIKNGLTVLININFIFHPWNALKHTRIISRGKTMITKIYLIKILFSDICFFNNFLSIRSIIICIQTLNYYVLKPILNNN